MDEHPTYLILELGSLNSWISWVKGFGFLLLGREGFTYGFDDEKWANNALLVFKSITWVLGGKGK